MFIRGQGVSKDLVSAYLWAKIASRKGNEKAKSLTERLETLLSAEDIAIVLEEVEKDRI
jgi:TPR repeat protein